MPAHVDIPRLRAGKVGGFFWCELIVIALLLWSDVLRRSVYVSCADPVLEGPDFLTSTWRVR
jgi:membrane dipeptidase